MTTRASRRLLGFGIPCLMLCLMLCWSAPPARAQADFDPAQVVGLFLQSCVKFAGDPQNLGLWIADHRLRQLPQDQAYIFLGMAPGHAYGASTRSGEHVLDAFADGACAVIAKADDPAVVLKLLVDTLAKFHVTVDPAGVTSKPGDLGVTHRFTASLNARRWSIALIEKPHKDAPTMAPEVDLFAIAE